MLDLRPHPNGAATSTGRYRPTLEEVAALSEQGNIIPVYREIMADLETPVSAYLKVATGRYSFLLESVEGGERLARYSFIGTDPYLTLYLNDGVAHANLQGYKQTSRFDDPLVALQSYLEPYRTVALPGLPRFLGGAVGYLSYEAVRYFERLPVAPADPLGFPDAFFMFVDTMLVFDHLERTIKVVSHVHIDEHTSLEESYAQAVERIDRLVARLGGEPSLPLGTEPLDERPVSERIRPNMARETYLGMVERAKEYIAAGDIIQVVLSQRLAVPSAAHPFTIYRALRKINPSPYMYYLNIDDAQIVGASPEMLVRLDGRTLTTHPIAGTRPRGATPEEDEALAAELAADEKENAEHIMLVDLGRNDIGRVARPGTVRVPQLMEIERYSHVMHIVSNVIGRLDPKKDAIDALMAGFPAGTVSGAPKVRAMEIIDELEKDKRGPYAGCVGYFSADGQMDTCIVLRTALVKDGVMHIQAGAGIVYDSIPENEQQECINKAKALVRAAEDAVRLSSGATRRQDRGNGGPFS